MNPLVKHAKTFSNLDEKTVFVLLRELIEIAEDISFGDGNEKKRAVINALKVAIYCLPESPGKVELTRLVTTTVIPDAIDLAIAVAKSKVFSSCLFKCC